MAERRRDKLQAFGLRHLRYVIAVADICSFRRAAAARAGDPLPDPHAISTDTPPKLGDLARMNVIERS
jgi:hypothetical protein